MRHGIASAPGRAVQRSCSASVRNASLPMARAEVAARAVHGVLVEKGYSEYAMGSKGHGVRVPRQEEANPPSESSELCMTMMNRTPAGICMWRAWVLHLGCCILRVASCVLNGHDEIDHHLYQNLPRTEAFSSASHSLSLLRSTHASRTGRSHSVSQCGQSPSAPTGQNQPWSLTPRC